MSNSDIGNYWVIVGAMTDYLSLVFIAGFRSFTHIRWSVGGADNNRNHSENSKKS